MSTGSSSSPTYGVFDEARFLDSGRDVRAFDTRFGRMGLLVLRGRMALPPPQHPGAGRGRGPGHSSASALQGISLRVPVVRECPALEGAGPGDRGGAWAVFVLVSPSWWARRGGSSSRGVSLAVGPTGEFLARGPLMEEGDGEGGAGRRPTSRGPAFRAPLLSDLQVIAATPPILARIRVPREGVPPPVPRAPVAHRWEDDRRGRSQSRPPTWGLAAAAGDATGRNWWRGGGPWVTLHPG